MAFRPIRASSNWRRVQSNIEAQTRGLDERFINGQIVTVQERLAADKVTVDGSAVDKPSTLEMLSELVWRSDHHQPLRLNDRDDTAVDVRGCQNRSDLLRSLADTALTAASVIEKVRMDGHRWYKICRGTLPATDSDGNDLPETDDTERAAAWEARRLLWNGDFCHYHEPDDLETYVRGKIAAATRYDLSSDLTSAKQQLLDRVNRTLDARCRYLFDGESEPANSKQREAKDSMFKERQKLVRALRAAADLTAAETAATAAETAINAINVEGVPAWHRLINDGAEPIPATIAYTRGSGKSKWKVTFFCKTAARSHALSLASGKVLLDGWTSTAFEIVDASNSATDGSLTFTLQRKGTGHPAAGSYPVSLTVRSLVGPSEQSFTVTVPAASG